MADPAARYRFTLVNRESSGAGRHLLTFEKPAGFAFLPGQFLRFETELGERDYSMASAPGGDEVIFYIREIGAVSRLMAGAAPGSRWTGSGPMGYFVYQASDAPAVFVATGTGIAPFAAMVRAGVSPHLLLHGVRTASELLWPGLFRERVGRYVPCLTGSAAPAAGGFSGRVTAYLIQALAAGRYDFYLCGSGGMIRDAVEICDERFPDSRVFTEIFHE